VESVEPVDARSAEAVSRRGSDYWLNLAAAGLVVFYVIYVAWQLMAGMMCSQIAVDYCEYLSAGLVANAHGYAALYNLNLLAEAQRSVIPSAVAASPVAVLPFLYLPVFVLPFQLLSRLEPAAGFWIWTVLNIAILIFYTRSFLRRLSLPAASRRLMLLVFISLPVFMNLFLGQMNLLLMVCVGEFMIEASRRRYLSAGLWLGGLLLKPQLLVLVGTVLVVQRAWRILAGAAITTAALGLLSAAMVGPAGLRSMLTGWLTSAGGQANIWVEGMMNWRMVGADLSSWSSPSAGWAVAIAGMLVTLTIMLVTWRKRVDAASPALGVAVVGVLAACATLAWHSHIHMAVVLLPPILCTYQARILPQRVLGYWVFVPALTFVTMVFVPETLMALHLVSPAIQPLIYFALGMGMLSANLYVFAWAVRVARQGNRAAT